MGQEGCLQISLGGGQGWRERVSVFYLLGEGVEGGGGPSYGQRYSPGCLEEEWDRILGDRDVGGG